jgi:hypothetical protein
MSSSPDPPSVPGGADEPIHVGPALWCTACRLGVFISVAESSTRFFCGQPIHCPRCNAAIDLVRALDHQLRDNFALIWAYGVLGAITSVHSFDLAPGGNAKIRFSDWGIPEHATVLSVNYMPMGEGRCFPLEVHANTPRWSAPNPAHEFLVYGFGPPGDTPARVNCSVMWFCPPDEDDGWDHLLEAFRSFASGRRERAIIPAHIAVESALAKAIADGLRQAKIPAGQDLGAFARQSNILLPLLADRFKCPRLPGEVGGRLKRLRQLRNEIAHDGASSHPLEGAEVARLLTAATLGFHYGRFLRKQTEMVGA